MSTREYSARLKGESWKDKLSKDIDKALEYSGSKDEFIRNMSILGYHMTWTNERKYLTFHCPNGKSCRDIKLHGDKYLKENIERELMHRDNVLGRISDEQYRMLSFDYNDEQKELEQSIPDLKKEIDTLKSECTNVQKFLDIVRKYVHVEELTPEVLRTFISKIVVHEREKKHSQTSPQQIDIYFRYIGTFALPSETIQAEENKQDERRTA